VDPAKIAVTWCDSEDDLPFPQVRSGETVSWQVFFAMRNQVLRVCRRYGTVGPMGEAVITDDSEGPPDPWPVEFQEPEYFVVDAQLSDTSLYQYVEVGLPCRITLPLLMDLWHLVGDHTGWGIGIGVPGDRYLYLQADGIWVLGETLKDCSSVLDVVERCQPGPT
jgi:hypothetical protein